MKKKSLPALPLPDGTLVRAGRECEEGVPILLFRVETPAFDAASGKTDAASFYSELARRTEAYLSGEFADLLRSEYQASDPARRRFTFRPAVYSHAVRRIASGDALTVEREVSLTRAGRVLFSRVFSEAWDPADGSFSPARGNGVPEKRRRSPKNKEKKAEKRLTRARRICYNMML